jgi:DNA-binding transcriptional LysR family regulator
MTRGIGVIDFRIKTFLAVWEEKGYTKAANRLALTQPAVSQHIKYLEEQLKNPLFKFNGREIALTDAGGVLYRYASVAESDGEKTASLILSGSFISRHIRFGATRTIGEYLLAVPIAEYVKKNPDTKFSLVVDNTDILLEKLARGQIDFAFIEGIFDRSRYSTDVFMSDSFIPVCSPRDPLAGRRVSISDLINRRLLVREQGSGSRGVLEHSLAEMNYTIDSFSSVFEIGNILAIKDLVAEGVGISFLYEKSVIKELSSGRIVKLDVSDFSVSHDYSFVSLKNSMYEAESKKFLEFCIDQNQRT